MHSLNEYIYVFYRLVTLFELSENMKTTKDNERMFISNFELRCGKSKKISRNLS